MDIVPAAAAADAHAEAPEAPHPAPEYAAKYAAAKKLFINCEKKHGAASGAPGAHLLCYFVMLLRDIDLDIDRGQVVVVIGPSGSGKSTLWRDIDLVPFLRCLCCGWIGAVGVSNVLSSAGSHLGSGKCNPDGKDAAVSPPPPPPRAAQHLLIS